MANYVQTDRPIHLTTPLGEDVLFLTEFHGRESLSALFQFELETVADVRTTIPFDALLGQKVTVKITTKQGHDRYFNGIVRPCRQATAIRNSRSTVWKSCRSSGC